MLRLLLTPADGGTSWRHALASGEARAGWECVGPHGLARRVGRLLGLPAETAPAPDRLAAFAARLDRDDDGKRSYSASRRTDPFGVASHLLGLRDRLRLAGWTGAALDAGASEKLADLSRLEAGARPDPLPPGLADVLARLASQLERRALPERLEVELAAPRGAFPPLVLALLDALAAGGARVLEAPADAPLAPEATDLGRLQRAIANPASPPAALTGDGSVLLLEADTALEAAELCASFLRRDPRDGTTLLVTSEPEILDAALARQGLPTAGLDVPSALRPHLQVLPLRLALAFAPQEPFRAAELLLLPGGPLPGFARGRLLEALAEMPGVGSPAWRAQVREIAGEAARRARAAGGSEADAAGEAAAVEAGIDRWFGGELADAEEGIRADRAAGIIGEVAAWLGSRTADSTQGERSDAALWSHAAFVARALERLLLSRPADERLRPVALMQLHAVAVGEGAGRAPWPAQAGRPAVAPHAADVLPGAARVLWWGFVQDVEVVGTPDAFTARERAALAAAGALLPAPGDVRAIEAWSWRRAVLAAREQVALVRWRLEGAEVLQAHPFADEIETRVGSLPPLPGPLPRLSPGERETCETAPRLSPGERGDDGAALPATLRGRSPGERGASDLAAEPSSLKSGLPSEAGFAACVVTSEAALAGRAPARVADLVAVEPAARIRPRTVWHVPGLAVEGTQSASQLRTLLGCPFYWALRYAGGLRPGRAMELLDGDRLLGDFAHRLLQDLLVGPDPLALDSATEDEARARAERAFDDRVATEAAPLVLRGRELDRERGRRLVGKAAAALVRHLRAGDWVPVAAEQELSGSFQGHPLTGYADLVVRRRRDGARAVIDLKLSGFRYRRGELEDGRGLQLALYASMLGGAGGRLPPAAYLILRDGELLTLDPRAFPAGIEVSGPTPEETLAAAGETLGRWKRAFAAGALPAAIERSGWEDDIAPIVGPVPGPKEPGRYPPECEYCDVMGLCQVELGVEAPP